MTSNEPNIGPTPSSFLDQSEEAASGGRRSLHFRRPKSAELRSGGQKGGGEERKNGEKKREKKGKKREMKGRERGKDPTRVPPAAASPGRGVLRRRRASPSGLGLHPERCRSQPDFAGPHRETGMRGGDLGVKNSEIRRFKAVFFPVGGGGGGAERRCSAVCFLLFIYLFHLTFRGFFTSLPSPFLLLRYIFPFLLGYFPFFPSYSAFICFSRPLPSRGSVVTSALPFPANFPPFPFFASILTFF